MIARLALAAVFLPAGLAAQPVASVPITLSNFHILPTPMRLAAGQRVTLTFINTSGSSHDFTAPALFARASNVVGPVERGRVELAPHQSLAVTLTPARGSYPAKCTHFGHKLMGMSAVVVVE